MTEAHKVLVYGATGQQGRPIVERLLAEGHAVRLATRTAATSPTFSAPVESVVADFDDADSLVAANEGCHKVVLLLPLIFDVAQAERWTANVVEAARSAGIDHLVFDASSPTPGQLTGVAAVDVRVRAEAILRESGLPTVVLRPTIYLDNLTAPWSAPGIAANHVVAYPLPADVDVSWSTWEHAAACVSSAISRPELRGRAFDIGAADPINGTDLASIFSRVLGTPHSYAEIPLEGFEQGLNAAMGPPVGTEIARLYAWFASSGRERIAADTSAAVNALGVTAESIDEWVTRQKWS